MTASLALKLELLGTVAVVIAIGVLTQLGWLSGEYAGIALGLATGSGVRSIVGSQTAPPPTVVAPAAAPAEQPPA